MRRYRFFLRLLVLGLAVAFVVPPAAAGAAGYRRYSNALSDFESPNYTGIHTYHAYAAATIVPGANCGIHYHNDSNFILTSQWLLINYSTTDPKQIEFGHSQQCNNENFVFWGYWFNGRFNEIDYLVRAPDSNGHTFQMYRTGGDFWNFYFDCCPFVQTIRWAVKGVRVQAGLESSHDSNVIPAHWFSDLQYTANESPWSWFAQDFKIVQNPPMCGRWVTGVIKWSASQNSPC